MTETEVKGTGDPLVSAIENATESAKAEATEETVPDSPYLAIMKEVIRASLPEKEEVESENAKRIRTLIMENDFGCCREPIAKMMALAMDEKIVLVPPTVSRAGRIVFHTGRNVNDHSYGERTFVMCFANNRGVKSDGYIGNDIADVDPNSDYYSRYASSEECEQFISDMSEKTMENEEFLGLLVALIAFRTQNNLPVK